MQHAAFVILLNCEETAENQSMDVVVNLSLERFFKVCFTYLTNDFDF